MPSEAERARLRSWIEELSAIGADLMVGPGATPVYRGSTTAGERKAGEFLSTALTNLGWKVSHQEFVGYSSFGARIVIHFALIAIAALTGFRWPIPSAIATVSVALSFFLEQTQQLRLLSWLLPNGKSQNIIGREGGQDGRPAIVLMAHYDIQRTGWCMSDAFLKPWSALRPLPVIFQLSTFPVTLAIGTQFLVLVAMAYGFHAAPVLYGCMAVELIGIILAFNLAINRFVPGATDNASGVATVITLAERWRQDPQPGVELIVVFTGCEETGLNGAAAWADANSELRNRSLFINVDSPCFGPTHYLVREVPLIGLPRSITSEVKRLADLVAAKAENHPVPIELPGPTDGLALLVRGFKGLSVVGCQPDGRLPHWHQLSDVLANADIDSAEKAIEYIWSLVKAFALELKD